MTYQIKKGTGDREKVKNKATLTLTRGRNYIASIWASDSRKRKGGFLAVFFCVFLLSVCNQLVIMLYTVLITTCNQSVSKV